MTQYRMQAETLALADYQHALGTIVTVHMISGYNEADDSVDIDGLPVQVRVTETPEDDLYHWVDEYLDPYWNVEPVDSAPELAGLRSFWTFGPSYRLTTNGVEPADNNQSLPHTQVPEKECPHCGDKYVEFHVCRDTQDGAESDIERERRG